MASRMNGWKVRTTGVVTGRLADGFFMQDPAGDGDVRTSDGLFVYRPRSVDAPLPDPGDRVTVEGTVKEYYGLTEIVLSTVTVRSPDNPLPPSVEVNPRKDDAGAASEDLEPLEGMRVSMGHARGVGPTKRYAATDEFYVVREEVFAALPFGRVFQDDEEGTGERIGVLRPGKLAPDVTVGDRVTGIAGPLHYTYGNYKVAQQGTLRVLPSPKPLPELPDVCPPAFSVATFNLENLFDTSDDPGTTDPISTPEQYDRKLTKLARAVRDGLRAPTVLAVQEVEHLSVLHDLSAHPELLPFKYKAFLLEGPDRRGIDVGILVRSDRVPVVDLDQSGDGGVSSVGTARSLFSRPPMMVEMKIDGEFPLMVIVNHFKSKRGGEAATEPRRIEQARFVAGLVEDMLDRDPDARVIVLGDLNDAPGSAPLRALTGAGRLRNLVPLEVSKAERYSFIYQGRAEVLDHILITPSLEPWLVRVDIAHLNADFPEPVVEDSTYRRCSDHDPIRAVFEPRSKKR